MRNFILILVFLCLGSDALAQQFGVNGCSEISSAISRLIPESSQSKFSVSKCDDEVKDLPNANGEQVVITTLKYTSDYNNTDLHYPDETVLKLKQAYNEKITNKVPLGFAVCTLAQGTTGDQTCYTIFNTNNPNGPYVLHLKFFEDHYEQDILMAFQKSATPTPTPSPTSTPISTPTEVPCLKDEEVNKKVDEILSKDGSVCEDGVLEKRSEEVNAVFKKACNKRDPYLPRGLDYMVRKVGDLPYAAWPLCHDHLYKAILASGYSLMGNPSQRLDDGTGFLQDNGWTCYSVEKESHPDKWGRGSQAEEVVVGLPKIETRPDLLLGVLNAKDFSEIYNPTDYPEKLKIKKGKKTITLVTQIDYKKQSAISLFSALKNSSPIPKVGNMNNDYYTQILKQIPRGSVTFDVFGVVKDESGINAKRAGYRFNGVYKQALACVPPKKTVVKDDDGSCNDYSLEKECVDELAKKYGLWKGMRDGDDKKGSTLKDPAFMRKAIRAIDKSGYGTFLDKSVKPPKIITFNRRQDIITMLAIIWAESKFNPFSFTDTDPDESYGYSQINFRGELSSRWKDFVKLFGSKDAIYYPLPNIAFGKQQYDGRYKEHKKKGKDPDYRFSPWTQYGYYKKPAKDRDKVKGRGPYRHFIPEATVAYNEYMKWKDEHPGQLN